MAARARSVRAPDEAQTRRRATWGLLALALALSSCASGSRLAGPLDRPATARPSGTVASTVEVVASHVVHVTDGDTIRVRMPDGRIERVRFIGVDTPESTIRIEPFGKESSAYTTRALAGRDVFLELDVDPRDRYGRLLAYVWLTRPTKADPPEVRASMFNARLLLDGFAQVLTVPPNVKYAELFLGFQREAREAARGLWALIPAAGGS
jgi:micrococcal nuclease